MFTQEKVALGLTQFIDFTAKGSSAKTNMVRRIKYQDEYHPAFDYWKQLRDGIIQFHSQGKDQGFLDSLILGVDEKKKENYASAIKQYRKFLRNKEVSWFDPGKAYWVNEKLVVRSSPELGLMIDGEPHLIKLYFKGKKEKVDKRTSRTVLALLNTSTFDIEHHHTVHRCVLNIHKNNFISDNTVDEDQIIALESEAAQFMYIWNKI